MPFMEISTHALTLRQLPPEEWAAKLGHLPFAEGGLPDPTLAAILVVEDESGAVIGVWAAMTAVHLDGLWVRPDHQRTGVAGKLLHGMTDLLQRLGIAVSFTIVQDLGVLCLAAKAGFTRVAGDLLIFRLPDNDM